MREPHAFPVPLVRPLAFLDLETTGVQRSTDRIIELAVVILSPGGDVQERVRRFNPGIPIPPEATAVHGIRDADVAEEPPFSRFARSLHDLLDPCDLAGFNIRRFDLPLLVAEFARSGIPFAADGRRVVDVQDIFHREEPRNLSAAARFYLGREHGEAHAALADIRTTVQVLAAQLDRYRHLPRDLDGLHQYCEEARPTRRYDGWFDDQSGVLVFARGKHAGVPLSQVVQSDPGYLEWMETRPDMDPGVVEQIRSARARSTA